MIKAIIIFPFNVLVVVPSIILYFSGCKVVPVASPIFIIACLLAVIGIFFMIWAMRLFKLKGKGTPAPWNPPQKLVVDGPYRHVRNPMLSGVFIFLLAEALFFGSWALSVYLLIFILANMVYFPLIEEKGLEKRFGQDYLEYKKNVPRYIPRFKPWSKQ